MRVIENFKIKRIKKLPLDKCTSFDYYEDKSLLFYAFGNDLTVNNLRHKDINYKLSFEFDILSLKYVPELNKLFLGSNKIICYDYVDGELKQLVELNTDNSYISKIEFDPYSKILYGFTFNCDIYGWRFGVDSITSEYKIINNFKSFCPMIVNPLSKSIIINKDQEEFYEVNLKTKRTKKWDFVKGTMLGFDSNSRKLIVQKKG